MISGVDTVSYAFRPEGVDALGAFRSQPHRSGPAGALVLDERGPDGGRVLSWQTHGIIAIETRLGALLAGDRRDHSLAPGDCFRDGSISARLVVSDIIGSDPGEHVEVRRYDLASELRFDVAAEGHAFLDSLRGLCPARMRSDLVVGADGHVQTAYVRTAKAGRVHSRAYDKGRESGTDPPGTRIRIESQNRPPKSKRQTPEALASTDLATIFGRTMQPYLAAEQVVAAGVDGAVAHLVAQAEQGELTTAKAVSLAGALQLLKYGGRAAFEGCAPNTKEANRRSARRLKALREAGIALDYELPADAVVPTGELLREAIAGFTA